MTIDLKALAAPFPADAISWRAQNVKADGSAALALAYLTARDVMDRLDDVLGPANWQDRYEVHGEKTICYLSVRVDGEWIVKADGGGDSDVEGEKGALSGALKRAAVKWGVGRYLYDLGNTWVDCESYEKGGKKYWKRWKVDPWTKVRNASHFLPSNGGGVTPRTTTVADDTPAEPQHEVTPAGRKRRPGPRLTDQGDIGAIYEALVENLGKQSDAERLTAWGKAQAKQIGSLPDRDFDAFMAAYDKRRDALKPQQVAS